MQCQALEDEARAGEGAAQLAAAEAKMPAALACYRRLGARTQEGIARNVFGLIYFNNGRYAQALAEYEAALTIWRAMGDRQGEATTRTNIGAALAIARKLADRAAESVALNNIGLAYRDQGKLAGSLQSLERALAITGEVGAGALRGAVLSGLASVYEKQARYPEALAYYDTALAVLEELRATAGSEQGRASFGASFSAVYNRAVALNLQQGRGEAAFALSERGRARAFLDSLATGQATTGRRLARSWRRTAWQKKPQRRQHCWPALRLAAAKGGRLEFLSRGRAAASSWPRTPRLTAGPAA